MSSNIGVLFGTGVVVAALLCSICVWSPRRFWIKLVALTTALLFLPVGYASLTELMSKPKPVALEWWLAKAPEATVLASTVREGKGIYLWLQLPDVEEPRAYVLPWSREVAEQLQKALEEAEESQGAVGMRLPFEPSLDDREPRFYALPQPALPQKDLSDPPAQRVPQPGINA